MARATDYEQVSIGGAWPLVRDPAAAGGIRFAVIGTDAPSDCVKEVADLPEAEVSIKLFAHEDGARAWAEAAAEYGGNAISASWMGGSLPAALIVRFDRDPRPGTTPDEVVTVTGDASRAATARSEASWRVEVAASRAEDERRWGTTRRAMKAMGEKLQVRDDSGGHAAFAYVQDEGTVDALRVTEDGCRHHLSFHVKRLLTREADLDAVIMESIRGAGLELVDGRLERTVDVADEDAVRDALRDVGAVSRAEEEAWRIRADRGAIRDALGRKDGPDMLRRLDSGLPLASWSRSEALHQLNPVHGHIMETSYSGPQDHLLRAGLIAPAWWDGHVADAASHRPFAALTSALWLLTPLGRDVARGLVTPEQAGPRVRASREAAMALVLPKGEVPVSPTLASLADGDYRDAWTPCEEHLFGTPPTPAMIGSGKRIRPPKAPKDLALVGAWTCCGLFDPESGTVLERAAPSP